MELLAYMDPCETHVFPLKFSTSNVCVKSFQSGDILANCLKSVWHEEKEKATAKPLSNSEDRICPIESHGSVFQLEKLFAKVDLDKIHSIKLSSDAAMPFKLPNIADIFIRQN